MLTLPVDRKESALYAERLAQQKHTDGTQLLLAREVPGLIRRHVKGGIVTLDYGCGPGDSSLFLRSLGLQVDGVDVNPHMISRSLLKNPHANFQLVNDGRIPAVDQHYDLVFSSWVFMEIGPKRRVVCTMSEIGRVMKPNGTFVAVVCSEDYYQRDWLNADTEFEENRNAKSGSIVKVKLKDIDLVLNEYFWTDADYREMIDEAGLRLVETLNPLGRDDDGYAWASEKYRSPITIYVAKKKKD